MCGHYLSIPKMTNVNFFQYKFISNIATINTSEGATKKMAETSLYLT